jgi:hypothetical protein
MAAAGGRAKVLAAKVPTTSRERATETRGHYDIVNGCSQTFSCLDSNQANLCEL